VTEYYSDISLNTPSWYSSYLYEGTPTDQILILNLDQETPTRHVALFSVLNSSLALQEVEVYGKSMYSNILLIITCVTFHNHFVIVLPKCLNHTYCNIQVMYNNVVMLII